MDSDVNRVGNYFLRGHYQKVFLFVINFTTWIILQKRRRIKTKFLFYKVLTRVLFNNYSFFYCPVIIDVE